MTKRATIVDQLDKSLDTWDWHGSLDHPIDELIEAHEDLNPVVQRILRPITALLLRDFIDSINHYISRTESPIEELMLVALFLAAHMRGGEVRFSSMDLTPGPGPSQRVDILVQEKVGKYRADFILRTYAIRRDVNGKIHQSQELNMIVECDGHQFHNATKEQVSRDRERDRHLQDLGYRVYRYPGSDIWSDVLSCAEDCVGGLLNWCREVELKMYGFDTT